MAREVGWQELSFPRKSERRDCFHLDESLEYKLPVASGRMIRAHDSLIRMVSTIRKEQGGNGKGQHPRRTALDLSSTVTTSYPCHI